MDGNFIQQCLSFLLVGALWGCTNPFLREGSKDAIKHEEEDTTSNYSSEKNKSSSCFNMLPTFVQELIKTFTNIKFIIPFALNQSGSMVYYYLLGTADISLASPICNSLTFTFTAITSWLIGEKIDSPFYTIIGIIFVLFGVTLCTLSRLES